MKIALTGGTGFIGSHFIVKALSAGHLVQAFRRNKESRTKIPLLSEPNWITGPLEQLEEKHFYDCDVLVHLAAHSVAYPYDSLENCIKFNLSLTLSVFEKARRAGVQKFIVAGSCFEYGEVGHQFLRIPTHAPLSPTNSYAASKAAFFIVIQQWAKEFRINMEYIRLFHVYGEGESKDRLWPSLREAALSGRDFMLTKGEQIRDFILVNDVATTLLNRAVSPKIHPSFNLYNMGSDQPRSIKSFSEMLWKDWNASGNLIFGAIPYRDNEVMNFSAGESLLIAGQ